MRVTISKVKAGDSLNRQLSDSSFVDQKAPADGILVQNGGGPRVYIRNEDLRKVIDSAEEGCSYTADSWRED